MDSALILLCGIPGAGKTTLARQIVEQYDQEPESGAPWGFAERVVVERISFDDLYAETTTAPTEFDPLHWRCTQDEMVRVVKDRLASARSHTESACHVLLVDDNFYYRSMRKRFYEIACEGECGFGVLHVATPIEVCRQRNAERVGAARVPEEQFENMLRAFEPPDHSWIVERNAVVIRDGSCGAAMRASSEETRVRAPLEAFRQALQHAAQDKIFRGVMRNAQSALRCQQIEDQKRTAENVVHNLDLVSRRWISNVLNGEDPAFGISSRDEKANLARLLNMRRKALLQKLKTKTPSTVGDAAHPCADPLQVLEHFRADLIQEFSAPGSKPRGTN